MNEITSLLLLYHMLCYTDFVPEASTRYIMGWSFILVTCSNLVFHFIMLGKNSLVNLKAKFIIKCSRKKGTDIVKEEENK